MGGTLQGGQLQQAQKEMERELETHLDPKLVERVKLSQAKDAYGELQPCLNAHILFARKATDEMIAGMNWTKVKFIKLQGCHRPIVTNVPEGWRSRLRLHECCFGSTDDDKLPWCPTDCPARRSALYVP
eukprot:3785762-Prymnesium_polylepis.1